MGLLHASPPASDSEQSFEDHEGSYRLQRKVEDLQQSHLAQGAILERLKSSEKRLQALMSASSDVVYRMSADWTEMYQLTGQEGQPTFLLETIRPNQNWLSQYIHPMDQSLVRQAISAAIESRSLFDLEHRVYQADGGLGWTHSRAVPITDDDGNILEWFGIASDITERKLSEVALIESEKLAAAGRVAGSVAHELYNPLDAVRNILWLLQSDESISTENLAYLKLADQEVSRVVELVKQALRPARADGPKSVRLGEVIANVLVVFAPRFRSKSISISKKISYDLATLCVEADVRQLIMILLNNSVDALPSANGKISLRVTHTRRGQQAGVKLTVADNGHGFTQNDRSRLFEAFFSTQSDVHAGLGLWIGKGIVTKLKGSVLYRSSDFKGGHWTVFTVFFPDLPCPEVFSGATDSL